MLYRRVTGERTIAERSKNANQRKKLGHCERDTIFGGVQKACILVTTDRKSRLNKVVKLNRRRTPKVTKDTLKALNGLLVKSITHDRRQEFSDHQNCSRKMKVKIYFCDVHSNHQRGTNENRIGILRHYFPKGMDLRDLSSSELE